VNLVRTIEDYFEPILLGRSPFDISGTLHALNEAMYNTLYAQAAVSDAMYDVVGRALGLPVHVLLGGECRDRVREIAVPTGPGLGVELDMDRIAALRVDR